MTGTVSLAKGQTVSLAKRDSFGDVRVNLNWSQGAPKKAKGLLGMFGATTSGAQIDLDLGCLYEMADGSKGCIQALGGNFGSFDRDPFVVLSGDDRTGQNADGETMRINGSKWNQIRRIAFFAFIYDGVADWKSTDGVVLVEVPGESPIRVEMGAHPGNDRMCAICEIVNENGRMKVRSLVDFHSGHQALDRSLGFGLKWVRGTKD